LQGVPVTKNFVRMAEKHQASKKHLQNQQNHTLLGRWRIGKEGESSLQMILLLISSSLSLSLTWCTLPVKLDTTTLSLNN
jgi:hypothetical protein